MVVVIKQLEQAVINVFLAHGKFGGSTLFGAADNNGAGILDFSLNVSFVRSERMTDNVSKAAVLPVAAGYGQTQKPVNQRFIGFIRHGI